MLLLPQEGKHEKMSKAPQTQHAADKSHQLLPCACHYCSARVYAAECVFVCEVGAFVLLRVLWQDGRCERWEASERLASPWTQQMAFHSKSALPFGPHFLSLLVKHVTVSASRHLCVRECALFCLKSNDSPALQPSPCSE